MQGDGVSAAVAAVTDGGFIIDWSLVVNIGMFGATAIYAFLTWLLWRQAIENQKSIVGLQRESLRKGNYFNFRRIWNSRDFIHARNRGERVWRHIPFPLPENVVTWANDTLSEDEWDNVSLVGHFMADLLIEKDAGNLTDTELVQGFPEFGWWAPRLALLFASFPNESRLVSAFQRLASLVQQQTEDERELKQKVEVVKT